MKYSVIVLCHTTEAAEQTNFWTLFMWQRRDDPSREQTDLWCGFTDGQQWTMHYPIRLFMSVVTPTIPYQLWHAVCSIPFRLHPLNSELLRMCACCCLFSSRHSYTQSHRIAVALPQPVTLKPQTMSFLGYPKVIPYTKFEHFWVFRFYRASAYCCWRAILI